MKLKSIASACCPLFLRPFLTRLEKSPLGRRLASGFFWSLFGAVLSRGLLVVASILVARMLGREIFGEFGMIRSTVNMFLVFAIAGLGVTANKHVAQFRKSDPERAGRITALSGLIATCTGSLVAAVLLVFAPWLAENTIDAPHLTGALRIGAVILFLTAINGAQRGALSGFEAFKTVAYVDLVVGILSFPILVGGAYFGGLEGAVWALGINLAFTCILNQFALRKEARRNNLSFRLKGGLQELSILWLFSLPATLGGFIAGPAQWACNAMLVNQPDGYPQMGFFTAVLVANTLLLFVGNKLSGPLLSMLSDAKAAKSEKLQTINLLASWGLGLFPAIFLLCFPEIFESFFGSQYKGYEFRVTFAIVVFYTCIGAFKYALVRVLASKNLLWLGFASDILWACILLSTARYTVQWGAAGLAAAYAISYVASNVAFFPVFIKWAKIPRNILVSIEAIAVWFVLAALVALVFWDISLVHRFLVLPVALGVSAWSFKRIWDRNTKTVA